MATDESSIFRIGKRGLTATILCLLAGAAAPALAQAAVPFNDQTICASLKTIVKAAGETPTFKSIVTGTGIKVPAKVLPPQMVSCEVQRLVPGKDTYACYGPRESETDVQVRQILVNDAIEKCFGVKGAKPSFLDMGGKGHIMFRLDGANTIPNISTLTGGQFDEESRFFLSVDVPSHNK